MIQAMLAAAIVGLILLTSEYLWHRTHLKGEFARKFVHIVTGSFLAFLPFWVSYGWIMVLSVSFVIVNLINRYSGVFYSIHAIKRKTWGDVLFGVGIFVAALLRPEPWVFTAAILHVGLADGFAAVVGSRFGKYHYKIFDHVKTPIGSFAFLVTSFAIILGVFYAADLSSHYSLWALLLFLPITTTLLENVSGYGADNVTVPLAVLALFSAFRL